MNIRKVINIKYELFELFVTEYYNYNIQLPFSSRLAVSKFFRFTCRTGLFCEPVSVAGFEDSDFGFSSKKK